MTEQQKIDMAMDAWHKSGISKSTVTETKVSSLFLLGFRTALNRECVWKTEDVSPYMPGRWISDCGMPWWFEDGGIKDNGMKFCPNCGGNIKQK